MVPNQNWAPAPLISKFKKPNNKSSHHGMPRIPLAWPSHSVRTWDAGNVAATLNRYNTIVIFFKHLCPQNIEEGHWTLLLLQQEAVLSETASEKGSFAFLSLIAPRQKSVMHQSPKLAFLNHRDLKSDSNPLGCRAVDDGNQVRILGQRNVCTGITLSKWRLPQS